MISYNEKQYSLLETSHLIWYSVALAILLLAGSVIKDATAIIITLGIIYFCFVEKQIYKAIVLWLLWFFVYGFYVGHGFFSIGAIEKYIAKPAYLLFLIFFASITQPRKRLAGIELIPFRALNVWFIFCAAVFIGSIYYLKFPSIILPYSSIFFITYLFQNAITEVKQIKSLINLLLAVAIIEIIVSFLQLNGVISRDVMLMETGTGSTYLWKGGLDDVASGTFGPANSPDLSWFEATISIFLFAFGITIKRTGYVILSLFPLLHFVLVDSKTILGITILMYFLLFYTIIRTKKGIEINMGKLSVIGSIVIIFVFVFINGLNFYYKSNNLYYAGKSPLEYTWRSIDRIVKHLPEWGKIRGFGYITNDFLNEDPLEVLFGYGTDRYSLNNKMGFIESHDTKMMKYNNITRSRSSLIYMYARFGLIAFVAAFITFYYYFQFIKSKYLASPYGFSLKLILKPMFLCSLLLAFLYNSISPGAISLISFFILVNLILLYDIKYHESMKQYNVARFIT